MKNTLPSPNRSFLSVLSSVGVALAMALLAPSCSTSSESQALGSETNWLKLCDKNADCGDDSACFCGLCTTSCEITSQCQQENASCTGSSSGALTTQCASTAAPPPGLCLPDCKSSAECGDGFLCNDSHCIASGTAAQNDAAGDDDGMADDDAAGDSDGMADDDAAGDNDDDDDDSAIGDDDAVADDDAATGDDDAATGDDDAATGDDDAATGDDDVDDASDDDASATEREDGSACSAHGECASGVCEGQGCELDSGTCVAETRACTRDLRQYCGCDDVTFSGSGSCPGDRYQYEGECNETQEPEPENDDNQSSSRALTGSACSVNSDCDSDLCEGEGCGEGGGTCVETDRACTRDVVQYCGCDGQTVTGSSSCAGVRYEYEGECVASGGAPQVGDGTEGSACDSDSDCDSGLCEGEGCGQNEGVCIPATRACTADIAEYCRCDGQTITGSSSCPGARYEYEGPCMADSDRNECATQGEECLGVPCCDGLICNGESSTCLPR